MLTQNSAFFTKIISIKKNFVHQRKKRENMKKGLGTRIVSGLTEKAMK